MLNILVAPDSQNLDSEQYAKRVVKYLKSIKAEYSVYFSTSMDDLTANAVELKNMNETDFVIIGDDVAINYLLNTIKDLSKIKLGIIPAGKTNDFAKFMRISFNPVQAIKDIMEKNVESVDYLIANDMIALNHILIGASADIYEIYNQYKFKNYFTKKYVRMKYGNKFEGIELSIDTKSSRTKKENIFDLSISNGVYQDGEPLSPLSNIHDGLFNLNYSIYTYGQNKSKYLSLFRSGKQIYEDQTKQFWLKAVKITNPNNKIKTYIDGRVMTLDELEVKIVESGLKLYMPKKVYTSSQNKVEQIKKDSEQQAIPTKKE